ncbi:MAG: NAD(P)H-dependent oxidoreductase [Actinomycetota bacterium]|nr:NAD(P)H-dependent oxidoreductase [Actinomycetota bacterium]
MEERAEVTILGIAGSLRAGSFNRGLIRAARALAPDGVVVTEFDLRPIPPFDADLEREGDPEPVAELKQAIREADALLIATPEYNRGTSGVLKNAIDWASRPALASPLAGKVVGLMGASSGMRGTASAQQQVRDALSFPRAATLEEPRILVPKAYEKFRSEDGTLEDTATLAAVSELVLALAAMSAKVEAA